MDTLTNVRHLPDINRSKAIDFSGGNYMAASEDVQKTPPHILGIYSTASPEGYVGGGMNYSRHDDVTIYQNGNVSHSFGWFATSISGDRTPVFEKHYVREGKVDEFIPKGETRLSYIPSNDIPKVVSPTIETQKPVIILGEIDTFTEGGEFIAGTKSQTSDVHYLTDGTKVWQGSRLFIRKDDTAVLEVGTFLTTRNNVTKDGATIGSQTKKYDGKAEIIPLKYRERGKPNIKPDISAFKFIQNV